MLLSKQLSLASNRNAHTRKGFTLIELLVVIAVIAILAVLLLPGLSSAKLKAHQATCLSNVGQLAQTVLIYHQDFGKGAPRDPDGVPGWGRRSGASLASLSDFRICPVARDVPPLPDLPEGGRLGDVPGTAASCWRFGLNGNPADDVTGTYALNDWFEVRQAFEKDPGYFRSAASVPHPDQTPLFADAISLMTMPHTNDLPATDLFKGAATAGLGNISICTIGRHSSKPPTSAPRQRLPWDPLPRSWGVNLSFDDGHATLVKLPDLWLPTWNLGWIPRSQPGVR